MTILLFIIFLIFAYLLGSINCAILVSKIMRLPDPRKQGSGNPGATNVLRSGSKPAAVIVLIGDVLKGVMPVALACLLHLHGFMLGFVGVAAVIGHMYPIFFEFKGGKGVATTFGVIFTLSLTLGIILLIVFLIIVAISRYVSLGSICSIAITPLVALFLNQFGYFIPLMMIAILVTLRHSENIYRLRKGTENKLKFKI